ncbi:MAG TPA: DUF4126 domain-containing protein [Acidobacteriaceae bacterium]
MEFSTASLISFLVALSFAAGLNLYATVAVLGLLARFNVAQLPHGLEAVGNTWVICVSIALFLVELFADKVPMVDVVWSALHTFIRIPVAALMAYKASEQLSPEMQLVVALMGAAVAAVVHGSKTAVRVAVTPSPEPVSNAVLSGSEDVVAIVLTWIATHHPVFAGVFAAVAVVICLLAARWIIRKLRIAFSRIGARFKPAPVVS